MRGTLTITVTEDKNGKTSIESKAEMENISKADCLVIIHQVAEVLKLNLDTDLTMRKVLIACISNNCWPDTDPDELMKRVWGGMKQ